MLPDAGILLLGGTAEANLLAKRIAERWPSLRLITSLAGRTATPILPAGDVRIGGFGGVEGLAGFIRQEGIARMIDATHPFAAGMSRNAAEAAQRTGIPRIAFVRPPWMKGTGDLWQSVACLKSASDALPPRARPFLALGRQHLAPFRHRTDLRPVLRMVDPPVDPLPFPADLVIGKPLGVQAEFDLFRSYGITHLVCRNSGGLASYAKIEAARTLTLPVIMIARPPEPPDPIVSSVEAALDWLAG